MKSVRCRNTKLSILTLLLLIGFSEKQYAQVPSDLNNATTVNLCLLRQSPKDFENKIVRVTAAFRFAFEVSELFCADCWDASSGRILVDFGKDWEDVSAAQSIETLKSSGFGKTMRVVLIGKFGAGEGRYQYRFTVLKAESAEILYKYSRAPPKLPRKVRKKTNCDCP